VGSRGNREQGTGNKSRDAPQGRRRLNCRKKIFWGGGILKGTGNREQGTGNMPCSPSVPGICSGTTPGKPIPSLFSGEEFRESITCLQLCSQYLAVEWIHDLRITPIAGLIFETKNRAIFLERFVGRGITAREQVSRALILARF